ncbi:MAG: hypothetical protein M1823_000852 [Watsoniomyces obsoletus]|nr:MAG: hypothetical protein M1823_000852 [Watsoniomyces obsoletus]
MPLNPRPAFHALSKLHQAAPLTRSEAHKLLHMLTTFFRLHLNADADGHQSPSMVDKPLRGHQQASSHQIAGARILPGTLIRRPKTATRSAHDHFRAILSHPLLATDVTADSPSNPLEPPVHDILATFRRWMALGVMTRVRAACCMNTHLRSLQDGRSREDAVNEMREWKLGTKVFQWLFSTDSVTSEKTLHDRSFLSSLIPYLIAEGHQFAIWLWLDTPLKVEKHSRAAGIAAKAAILMNLVRAEIDYGMGINPAISHYLRATQMRKSEDATSFTVSPEELKGFLRLAGVFLMKQCVSSESTVIKEHVYAISETLEIISRWPAYDRARLLLTSPTVRDPEPALAFLQEADKKPLKEMLPMGAEKAKSSMTMLGLRTTQRLLELDRLSDAEWVLQFLQWRFPFPSPDDPVPSTSSAALVQDGASQATDEEQERVSLGLLEKLRVG